MSPKTRQREKKLAKGSMQREASQRLDTFTDETDTEDVTIGNRQNREQSTSQTPAQFPSNRTRAQEELFPNRESQATKAVSTSVADNNSQSSNNDAITIRYE